MAKETKLTKTDVKNSISVSKGGKSKLVLRRVVQTFDYLGAISKKKVK